MHSGTDEGKMKLQDLPEVVLSQIVSNVIPAPRHHSPHSTYTFQITVTEAEWAQLSPLRSSCRALRDACRLAISGLRHMPIATNVDYLFMGSMPLRTALSLPCLVSLEFTHGPGLSQLLVRSSTLRSLCVSNDIQFNPRELASWNGDSLQEIHLNMVDRCQAFIILQALSSSLRTLYLEVSHSDRGPLPLLSREAAASVEDVTLKSIDDMDVLFLQLMNTKNLRRLSICNSSFSQDIYWPSMLNAPPKLHDLTYDVFECYTGFFLEEMIAKGKFGNIDTFYYRAFPHEDVYKAIPMIQAMVGNLKKLTLLWHHGVDTSLIRALVGMKFKVDCRLELEVFAEVGSFVYENSMSVTPLLKLRKCLKSLNINSGRHLSLMNLNQLGMIHGLEIVKFEECLLSMDEVCILTETLPGLRTLEVTSCYEVENHSPILSTMEEPTINLDDLKEDRWFVATADDD